MREYICHKRVKAGKITALAYDVLNDGFRFALENGGLEFMSADWYRLHHPNVGGYLVEYGDGYRSFSPAKPFEEGYALAHE